ELQAATEMMTRWYRDFAARLVGRAAVPAPLTHDASADSRLVAAVSQDLRSADGDATATAVRMIWTGDHLDAARRLQASVAEPALFDALQRGPIPRRSIRVPQ
ncbi:MAG: hypothetical protein JWN32_1553, partial [Solirubrobacterales bacterium]|nr:hypothetical protein [Solirubrobacterales bacterium]